MVNIVLTRHVHTFTALPC